MGQWEGRGRNGINRDVHGDGGGAVRGVGKVEQVGEERKWERRGSRRGEGGREIFRIRYKHST